MTGSAAGFEDSVNRYGVPWAIVGDPPMVGFDGTLVTVISSVVLLVAPAMSVTAKLTGYCPAVGKVYDAVGPVASLPSGNSQVYEYIDATSVVEASPLKVSVEPSVVVVLPAMAAPGPRSKVKFKVVVLVTP